MRKWLLLGLVLVLLTSVCYAGDIGIKINGTEVGFNASSGSPFIDENNRVLVPFRMVLEEIGATVYWNDASRLATAYKDGIEVVVPIGQTYILKDGQKILNDTKARIVDGRTYLPIRVVMEAFHYDVGWDALNQKVLISNQAASGMEGDEATDASAELPVATKEANTLGNSNGNLHNGGIITKEYDTIYYVNFEDDETLYSYNILTQESERLTDRAVRKLNVVNGMLYFLQDTPYNTWDAFQMKVDGSDKKRLGSSNVSYIGAFEEGVYFYNVGEERLFYQGYDKSYPEKVIDEVMEDIQIVGNDLFYVEMDEDDAEIPNKVIRINLDTLERKTILDERIGENQSCIVANDRNLFFCKYNDALTLYRSDLDGNNIAKVSDDHIYDVNSTEDRVYYLNPYFDKGIVAMDLDGENEVKVLNGWDTGDYVDPLISYLDGSIYYRRRATSSSYYLYRVDLSKNKEIRVKNPSDLVD